MAGGESAGCAGEAAVGEQGYVRAEFGVGGDGGGDLQHFSHAGTALGTFVADDEDVAGVDLGGLDGGEAIFFVVKDARRAAMLDAVGGGDFHHAAFGGEVAFEDDKAAGGFDGIFKGVDDDLAGSFLGEGSFFSEGAAADGEGGTVGVAGFNEAPGEKTRTAGGLVVGSYESAGWS